MTAHLQALVAMPPMPTLAEEGPVQPLLNPAAAGAPPPHATAAAGSGVVVSASTSPGGLLGTFIYVTGGLG